MAFAQILSAIPQKPASLVFSDGDDRHAVRLTVPILIGVYALDKAITGKDMNLLLILICVISLMYLINYGANVLRIRWMNMLGQHVIYDVRRHLFTHVQRLSHRFFDERSAGSILVRIMNDINSLQELFTSGVINLLMDILLLLGIIVILFSLSPELTIAIMITPPVMFFISTNLRRKIRRSWQKVRLKQSKLNSHLNESIQGIRVTQAFTQEKENMMYFDGVNGENLESWREATKKCDIPPARGNDECGRNGDFNLVRFKSHHK